MPSIRGNAARVVENVCRAYDEANNDLRAVSMCLRHATAGLVRLHRVLGELDGGTGEVAARMAMLSDAVEALSVDFLALHDAIGMVQREEAPVAAVAAMAAMAAPMVPTVVPTPVPTPVPTVDATMGPDEALLAATHLRASETYRRLSLHLAVRRETAGLVDGGAREAEGLAQAAVLHALYDLAVDRVFGDGGERASAEVTSTIGVIVDALRGAL